MDQQKEIDQHFLDTILSRRGQIVTMTTKRNMKVRKGQAPIEKISKFQVRVGVSYDNIAAVKEKRESGELPKENKGLPWGEWEIYPYVIVHKGERYIRCTAIDSFAGYVKYYRNGTEIPEEETKAACLSSEFGDKSGDVFNVKLSSILEVF